MSKYLTIPDELLGAAEATEEYFRAHGYKVKPENRDLAYPYVPAFTAIRNPTSVIVEIQSAINLDRVKQWMRYCKSCTKDMRFATCVPAGIEVPTAIVTALRRDGIGLYNANDEVMEILPPADQAVALQLPELGNYTAPIRDMLGSSYEKCRRGDWREGFEDACQAFENEARAHLKRGLKSGRIKILDKTGNPKKLTAKQIDKKTIGQLQHEFKQIQSPNYLDSQIAQTLEAINSDRVGVVHKKRKSRTEASLRKNVGHLMWTIINCVVEMKK
jgi:hypothetical protein